MNANAQVVVITRVLLPAGLEPLRERFEVRVGGIDATREKILSIAPRATALVADPSVAIDSELLDACGSHAGSSLRPVGPVLVKGLLHPVWLHRFATS